MPWVPRIVLLILRSWEEFWSITALGGMGAYVGRRQFFPQLAK